MVDKTRPGSTDSSSVSRRSFLTASGAFGSAAFLTGCLGDGDGSDPTEGGTTPTDSGSTPTGTQSSDGEFPSESINMIIGFAAGGGYDMYTRLISPPLADALDTEFGVHPRNVTGSGGRIAIEQVYNAEPDGHTNILVNFDNWGKQQVVYDDANFDIREMTYYAQIISEPRAIIVAEHAGIDNFDQWVEAIQNEELRFGGSSPTAGGAMVPAIIGELSGRYSADKVLDNFVPYEGTADVQAGMIAGDVEVLAGSAATVIGYAEHEAIEPFLSVSATDPPQVAPDLPTLVDEGIDEDNAQLIEDGLVSTRAFAGPPGMSDERAQTMRDAFDEAIESDYFQQRTDEAERPVNYQNHEVAQRGAENKVAVWQDNTDLLPSEDCC